MTKNIKEKINQKRSRAWGLKKDVLAARIVGVPEVEWTITYMSTVAPVITDPEGMCEMIAGTMGLQAEDIQTIVEEYSDDVQLGEKQFLVGMSPMDYGDKQPRRYGIVAFKEE